MANRGPLKPLEHLIVRGTHSTDVISTMCQVSCARSASTLEFPAFPYWEGETVGNPGVLERLRLRFNKSYPRISDLQPLNYPRLRIMDVNPSALMGLLSNIPTFIPGSLSFMKKYNLSIMRRF